MIANIRYGSHATWDEFVSEVRSQISVNGAVIVRELFYEPENDLLPRLAASLGRLSLADVTAPDVGNSHVHAVEAKIEPLKDTHGFLILSTTSNEFPCHTDDYFEKQPSDIVLLQCVRQADVGGDSLVAHLDDILRDLDPETRDFLIRPVFPTHCGQVAILENGVAARSIRYNRVEIERSSDRLGIALSQGHFAALDKLDAAIARTKQRLRLAPGDCLAINNKMVVHGRSAFSAGSDRLFRRVKIYT